MKLRLLLSLVVSLSLTLNAIAQPISRTKQKLAKLSPAKSDHRGFIARDVNFLNRINTTHKLANAYLKLKTGQKFLNSESKKILEEKSTKLSAFGLVKKDLFFSIQSDEYSIKYIGNSKYKIRSKNNEFGIIDFDQKDLGYSKSKFKTSKNALDFLIPEAHAAVPLLLWWIGATVVAVVVASGCVNISIDSYFGKEAVPDALFLDNSYLSREFRNIRRKLKLDDVGCAVNASSLIDDNLDFESVLKHACGIQKQGKDVRSEFESSPEKYEFQACFDDNCAQKQEDVYFNQLDELNQNLILGFVEDQAFMSRSCVPQILNDNSSKSKTKNPESVDQPAPIPAPEINNSKEVPAVF